MVRIQVATPATERLDRFLADQLALSRTLIARLVAAGAVRVNEAPARASRLLAYRDLIEVTLPESVPIRVLRPHDIPLTVVYEDDHLLVLDKPAGLVVHPAPGHWDDTLLNALVARGVRLPEGSPGRPGIVHRLDKDTSGLLIVAKTDVAHRRLSHALALRRIERVYAALVWGHVDQPIEIDQPLARHPRDRTRMAVLEGGRPAKTRVEPVARFRACDLVRVRLGTGRTHQIRVHLAFAGHPVVGDPIYGGGGARRVSGPDRVLAEAIDRSVTRQALHAAALALAHPESRQWLQFRSEWPDDLDRALALAGEDSGLLARPNPLEYLGFFK